MAASAGLDFAQRSGQYPAVADDRVIDKQHDDRSNDGDCHAVAGDKTRD
jgi:hypothetical protein